MHSPDCANIPPIPPASPASPTATERISRMVSSPTGPKSWRSRLRTATPATSTSPCRAATAPHPESLWAPTLQGGRRLQPRRRHSAPVPARCRVRVRGVCPFRGTNVPSVRDERNGHRLHHRRGACGPGAPRHHQRPGPCSDRNSPVVESIARNASEGDSP